MKDKFVPSTPLVTPVLFLIFNRPDTTRRVFEYVLNNIDWECKVKTLFRDKNLGCKYAISGAISDKKQVLTYYVFNEPALNGFSKELSAQRDGKGGYRIIDEIKIETSTLTEVLDTYLPEDIEIDFLSVDVEGLDFQVLKSNNWNKYKPKVVLVESLDFSFHNLDNSEIYRFLVAKGYHLAAKTVNTLFFVSNCLEI